MRCRWFELFCSELQLNHRTRRPELSAPSGRDVPCDVNGSWSACGLPIRSGVQPTSTPSNLSLGYLTLSKSQTFPGELQPFSLSRSSSWTTIALTRLATPGGIIVEKLANRIGLLSSQKHPVLELMFSIIIFTLSFACGMSGQTFSVLHTFTGGSDGATPTSGLTSDGAGNFYGTTRYGGYLDGDCAPNGCGTVFKIELFNGEWILSTLYTFKGETDGFRPEARVVFGQDGALYGTTSGLNTDDGDNIGGTIFNLVPPGQPCKSANCVWTKKVLYQFGNTDCTAWSDYETCTYGDLIFDNQGNIYGTTSAGGTAGYGQVYELSRSGSGWIFTTLYSFAIDDDGDFPYGGVIFDRDGNLWGTTSLGPRYGDVPGFGVAFKLTPSSSGWVESWAYLPGEIPYAGLAIDRRGNMFGTTWAGGPGLCTGGGIDVPFQVAVRFSEPRLRLP